MGGLLPHLLSSASRYQCSQPPSPFLLHTSRSWAGLQPINVSASSHQMCQPQGTKCATVPASKPIRSKFQTQILKFEMVLDQSQSLLYYFPQKYHSQAGLTWWFLNPQVQKKLYHITFLSKIKNMSNTGQFNERSL